jgi:ATP-binding cassette, subfamily F, member 3
MAQFGIAQKLRLQANFTLLCLQFAAMDFGDEIRENLPEIDETVLEYVEGYVNDEDSLDEDIPSVVYELLESFARGKEGVIEELLRKLDLFLKEKYKDKPRNNAPKLTRLDRVMDMSKTGMSKTIALAEGVDLESINKSKFVYY